jgi:hypothetical protein
LTAARAGELFALPGDDEDQDEAEWVEQTPPVVNEQRVKPLIELVSELAPITGLWPVVRSEWDYCYHGDFSRYSRQEDHDSVAYVQQLLRHSEAFGAPAIAAPASLAQPGADRPGFAFPAFNNFGLVQADSYADLLKYGVCESLNNDQSWWHWISLVERFELQVVMGEWHLFGLFMHRPPATRSYAEILRVELLATGADDCPSAHELLS